MNEQEEKDPVERAADSILRLQLIEVNRSLLEDAIRRAVDESYGLTGGLLIDILKKRSEAYVKICSALNEINPGWWKAPTSVGEDAANFIRELAQQALEPKAGYLKYQAEAWASVVKTLHEVYPEWALHPGTGEEAAIAAIRKLARKAAKKKAKKAQQGGPRQIEQLIIDWDKAPGWATRVCSTPTGCLLYADNKHYTSFDHPESRYELNAVGEWKESQLEVICTRPAPKAASEPDVPMQHHCHVVDVGHGGF